MGVPRPGGEGERKAPVRGRLATGQHLHSQVGIVQQKVNGHLQRRHPFLVNPDHGRGPHPPPPLRPRTR